jgi:hypothetical protein
MVMNIHHLTLSQVYDRVCAAATNVTSRPVVDTDMFSVIGTGATTCLAMSGMEVMPTAAYQVKAAGGLVGLDTRNISGLTSTARMAKKPEHMERARSALQVMASGLNSALGNRNLTVRPLKMRVGVDDFGNQYVGGVVTDAYVPLSHRDFIGRMLEHPSFKDAAVHKYSVNDSRLEIMMLLDGSEWSLDGGMKSGINCGNGQFGDKAASIKAMLFRLLCSNGMMAVESEGGMWRRHVGAELDLAKELEHVLKVAENMIGFSMSAMDVKANVVSLLAEAYRRGHINRGAFIKSIERRNEVFSGVGVTGATDTLWGASQAITAAARDYSLVQERRMAEFAGKLVHAGDNYENVINLKYRKTDISSDDVDGLLEQLGVAA